MMKWLVISDNNFYSKYHLCPCKNTLMHFTTQLLYCNVDIRSKIRKETMKKRHKYTCIHRPEDVSTHNVELEQWGLGTVWLDGESLDGAPQVQIDGARQEREQGNLSGINLQTHQQAWKHLRKLQRRRTEDGEHFILWYSENFKDNRVKKRKT